MTLSTDPKIPLYLTDLKLKLIITIISSKQFELEWILKEEKKYVNYKVFRNGKLIQKTGKNEFTDVDIIRNQTYEYFVEAYDSSGRFARSNKEQQSAWLVVSLDGRGDFLDIQTAVDSARTDEVIYVKSGIYKPFAKDRTYEDVGIYIDKSNLTLLGESPFTTIIDADGKMSGILIDNATNIRIEGFLIKNAGRNNYSLIGEGIFARSLYETDRWLFKNYGSSEGYLEVIRNVFNNCEKGVKLEGYSKVKIVNNVFSNSRGSDAYVLNGFSDSITIINNIFYDNDGIIEYSNSASMFIEYNAFWKYRDIGNGYSENTLSNTNIFVDPKFENPKEYNFQLNSTSPCLNKGINGLNMGVVPR